MHADPAWSRRVTGAEDAAWGCANGDWRSKSGKQERPLADGGDHPRAIDALAGNQLVNVLDPRAHVLERLELHLLAKGGGEARN